MKHRLAINLLCALGFLAAPPLSAQPTPRPGIPPLTVTYQAKSGPSGLVTKFVEAYRSDGSMATIVFRDAETLPAIISITDATKRQELVKDPPAKQYTVLPTTPQAITRILARPTTCQEAVGPHGHCLSGPSGSILGYRIESASLTISDGPPMAISFAPDLGYLPFFRQRQEKNSTRVTMLQAVSIILGEPDPALFALPPDYTRTSPSPQ